MIDLVAELVGLVDAFDKAGIEYALCGGFAVAIYGAPRATKDIDILALPESLPKIRDVAHARGFVFDSLPMTFSSTGISMQRHTKLEHGQPIMLDVLVADRVLQPVWLGREQRAWAHGTMWTVSRDGLITLKTTAGRPQDLADLQRLVEVEGG